MKTKYIKASAFSSGVGALDAQTSTDVVVCGFLINGLVDSYEGEGDLQAVLTTTISIYASSIKMAQERSKSRMFVISPMARPSPPWLRESIPWITTTLKEKLGHSDMIELLPSPSIPDQLFESDRIHLNDLGLSMMHAHFMAVCPVLKRAATSISRDSVSEVFEAGAPSGRKRGASPLKDASVKAKRSGAVVDEEMELGEVSEEDDNVHVVIDKEASSGTAHMIRTNVKTEMSKFVATQNRTNRNVSTNFQMISKEMFLQWESNDEALNKTNSNIILITGLPGQLPKDRHAKNKLADTATAEFIKSIGLGRLSIMFSTFIPGPPPKPKQLPMLKIAFGSPGDAHMVRMAFNSKRKSKPQDYSEIFITPELMKSTRVRAAILMAFARKNEVMHLVPGAKVTVTRYDPRPDLCYRDGKTGKIEKRVSYYECFERFGKLLTEEDLVIPRKIAGKNLAGRMQMLFLVSNVKST